MVAQPKTAEPNVVNGIDVVNVARRAPIKRRLGRCPAWSVL
jgi:hypothetical protein